MDGKPEMLAENKTGQGEYNWESRTEFSVGTALEAAQALRCIVDVDGVGDLLGIALARK